MLFETAFPRPVLRATAAGLLALAAAALCLPTAVRAQPEAEVKRAIQNYVETWNRHDVDAWLAHLGEDVWYAETDDTFYKRFRGREKVKGWFEHSVKNSRLQWDVVKLASRPDGSVSVVLNQRQTMLAGPERKPGAVYDSQPSFARWRREGTAWKLYFFTSHKGWALAEMKKDGLE